MREIVEAMAAESEVSMIDLAAALLFQKQMKQPLQPKEDPKPRRDARERNDRNDRGNDRNSRGNDRNSRGNDRNSRGNDRNSRGTREERPRKEKVNRNDVDWQTYRLEVGKEHGARPGDIVGAIANEISLDSSYIGAINLHEKHSFVQLPKGIPADLFDKLKSVRVRRQPLAITTSDEAVVSQKRAPRRTERAPRHS
ncbi:MAG: DbpA RNA binding domain-containing protein, partial [Colwellia sp.]|nr:DbpA RNA binding domain-containing protein [Colwellia sp.]